MLPSQAIDSLLTVPYAPGQGDLAGADCWGIVELWYRHVLGIEVTDRAEFPAGNEGLQAGFDARSVWQPIDEPADHCLVILRFRHLDAGHVGIFYQGSVLHSSEGHGCVYQPITHRLIRPRITRLLAHT
ncbi:MAG: NlpC/P60 family protein [Devosia sp.]